MARGACCFFPILLPFFLCPRTNKRTKNSLHSPQNQMRLMMGWELIRVVYIEEYANNSAFPAHSIHYINPFQLYIHTLIIYNLWAESTIEFLSGWSRSLFSFKSQWCAGRSKILMYRLHISFKSQFCAFATSTSIMVENVNITHQFIKHLRLNWESYLNNLVNNNGVHEKAFWALDTGPGTIE